jgi:coenzyme F420-0:L-glutamate ligase / coenzyme F420-1:gamma-L-glutamate ligase
VTGGTGEIRIQPLTGLPEVLPGDDLAAALAALTRLSEGDVLAVSQKVVSKQEGRLVNLEGVDPGPRAVELAAELDRDPRLVELILGESIEVVRTDPERGILITETRHGFICANAGIDSSNVPGGETIALLPEDPDGSARRLRAGIAEACGVRPAVIISDSFGRAWRLGQAEIAIGCAGIDPLDDWRGRTDSQGRELAATLIATADQIAAAADLGRDKTSRTPAVLIRGLAHLVTEADGPGCRAQLRPADEDLFR